MSKPCASPSPHLLASRVGLFLLLVAGCLAAVLPASAATTSQFANGWSVFNNADWTPFPPNTSPLGAPNDFCTGGVIPGSWAQFTFPSFGIPAGDFVTGIEVRLNYLSQSGSNTVQLTKMGALVGSTRTAPQQAGTSFCSSTVWVSAGGAGDLWGTSLSTADFNAGTVGFRLTQNANTVDLDAVEIIVYHGPANSPPTAEAGGPYSVAEGGAVTLSGAASTDPDQATNTLTFAWDLDNNGTFETAGIAPTFSAAGLDGPTSRTVTLRVTDNGSLSDTDTATVNVSNVPPSLGVSSPSVAVAEGATALNSGSVSDPGSESVTVSASVGTVTQASGTWSWSFATSDGPDDSQTVTINANDGDATTSVSFALTVHNVAPSVAADDATVTVDEGQTAGNTGTFADPGNDVVTVSASIGTVSQGSGTWSWSFATSDGPDDSQTVTVQATDSDGASSSTGFELVVENVPPTIDSLSNDGPIDEGQTATVSIVASDPAGVHDPLLYELDCRHDGTFEIGPQSSPSGSCQYGDDGGLSGFDVAVRVTDDDGASDTGSSNVIVRNVDPTATLDVAGAISFPGGDAFLGRQGVEQEHDAQGDDPGSEDLTFDWSFPPSGSAVSVTYFNDTGTTSGTPDPAPSPDGSFPFSAADTASVTFADPGLYTVIADVTDDDGGSDSATMAKLVTGGEGCSRSQGFWRHQFRGKGRPHFDASTLQAYLDVVDFASSVFSELVPAFDPGTANAALEPAGNDKRAKATQQALAAWLNFATGAVGWNEGIDLDGDELADAPFQLVIGAVESILLDPAASHADLVLAKDLAEAVNLRDELDPACAD